MTTIASEIENLKKLAFRVRHLGLDPDKRLTLETQRNEISAAMRCMAARLRDAAELSTHTEGLSK